MLGLRIGVHNVECSRSSQAELLEGYRSLCGEMRGGFTAYVWLTSLYPSLGWILCGISGRTDLNIGGGAAASCLSSRHVVRHGWVNTPVASASASLESSTEDLQRLTVVQLKARLKELGLIVGGKKVELVERLRKGINASTGGGKKEDNPNNNDNTRISVELSPPLNGDLNDQGGNINSLMNQEEEHHECELLDYNKVATISSTTDNSNDELDKEPVIILETKKQNMEEELLSLSKPKPPKPRLLTDDDLLPPKRSKHSPSNNHFRR